MYKTELAEIGLDMDELIEIQSNENIYEIVEIYTHKIIQVLDCLKFGSTKIRSIAYEYKLLYDYILWNFHDTEKDLYIIHKGYQSFFDKPNTLLLTYLLYHILDDRENTLGTQITKKDIVEINHLSVSLELSIGNL